MSDEKLPPLDLTEALARGHDPRRHLWPIINHLHPQPPGDGWGWAAIGAALLMLAARC